MRMESRSATAIASRRLALIRPPSPKNWSGVHLVDGFLRASRPARDHAYEWRYRGNVSTVHERIQEEVSDIAEVLARQQKKSLVDVWQEALSLHRVRYETVVANRARASTGESSTSKDGRQAVTPLPVDRQAPDLRRVPTPYGEQSAYTDAGAFPPVLARYTCQLLFV
jgi:hypothetical protein